MHFLKLLVLCNFKASKLFYVATELVNGRSHSHAKYDWRDEISARLICPSCAICYA